MRNYVAKEQEKKREIILKMNRGKERIDPNFILRIVEIHICIITSLTRGINPGENI